MFNLFKRVILFLVFWLIFLGNINAQNVKIIEFGWDYPNVTQMATRLDSMQNTPFDGICFSLQRQVMEAFDTSLQTESYFELKSLQALKWGKYSSNFIIVRGSGKMGANWFDDKAWSSISRNMSNLSKAMQIGNLSGIFFDPEYYYENKRFNPWTFSSEQYPGKSLLQVQNMVKQRGKQFISSLQSVKHSFNFISVWIASLIAQEIKYTPLSETHHVLLVSFFEGIFENKNKSVAITDGNEYAYWNTKLSEFLEARALLKSAMLALLHSKKSKTEAKNMQIAQPVFYDGLIATSPSFEKGLKVDTKWKWLNQNIKFAIASSDKYVWFYSERLSWWNGNLNDTALAMLQENRSAFIKNNIAINSLTDSFINNITDKNIDSKQGYYIDINKNKNEIAFDFDWNLKLQNLSIYFRNKLPATTSIYINNGLVKQFVPINLKTNVTLPTFDKGTMVIINEYEDKTESSAIYISK